MVAEAQPKFGKFTDDADEEIDRAADRYKIDPDFLKAIIAAESAGDWENNARCVYAGGRYILPYVGMTSPGPFYPELVGNREEQINLAAKQIATFKKQIEEDVYSAVAQTWFAGPPRETWPSAVEFAQRVTGWAKSLRKRRQ